MIVVDKVVVSGGYMMVCIVDKIVSVLFVIVGFIGVVVQLLNFYKLLKKNDIEFEQFMVGEYKCILIMFGENIDKVCEKFK